MAMIFDMNSYYENKKQVQAFSYETKEGKQCVRMEETHTVPHPHIPGETRTMRFQVWRNINNQELVRFEAQVRIPGRTDADAEPFFSTEFSTWFIDSNLVCQLLDQSQEPCLARRASAVAFFEQEGRVDIRPQDIPLISRRPKL